jgi:hypothetical protein
MASVLTLDFLKLEAAKGQRSDFESYLGLVPNTLPQVGDELVLMKSADSTKNYS